MAINVRSAASAEPTAQREVVIDAVRGVALFGVLTVNTITAFRVSLFEQFLPPALQPMAGVPHSSLDSFVARAVTIGFEMKAFILFSFLFGVGLAAQKERLAARSTFGRFATRRIAFLLVMGLIHLVLIWNGDILTFYAVIGTAAATAIAFTTRARTLLLLAAVCFIVHVLPFQILPYPPMFPNVEAIQEHVDAARHIYPFGSFRHELAFRIVELRPISVLLMWSIPRTLGMFLLGGAAWRARIFQRSHARHVSKIAVFCLFSGVSAMTLVHATDAAGHLGRAFNLVDTWGSILLSLGYGSGVVALYHAHPTLERGITMLFASIGRMALTSYLTQSIVLSFIFYGIGLGKFGMLGEAETFAIVIAIYTAQIIFAREWLRRFRFGPVEWLWRSFTYGARQPLH